jgi:hypothetical protein
MSYIPFNGQSKPRSQNLRTGLDQWRDGFNRLVREMRNMQQMSDNEVMTQYDVQASADNSKTALENASTLKAELTADISKLLDDASTGAYSAMMQLLDFTG